MTRSIHYGVPCCLKPWIRSTCTTLDQIYMYDPMCYYESRMDKTFCCMLLISFTHINSFIKLALCNQVETFKNKIFACNTVTRYLRHQYTREIAKVIFIRAKCASIRMEVPFVMFMEKTYHVLPYRIDYSKVNTCPDCRTVISIAGIG